MLQARAVSHSYGAKSVLADVDVSLKPGECVALIGPNGAGKTTLLRILCGILEPLSGRVEIDGASLASQSRRQIARRISVVPQSRPPAFAFSAMEFVLMGFHARAGRFSLDGNQQRDAATDALERLGVGEFAHRSMTALSGGEAQRVVMARTIVSGADHWLLDEPTASLDMAHQLALLKVVRQHCNEGGAALAILHDVNLVERWFDRVLVLADGQLIGGGPPGEVLTPATLQAAFGLPMRRIEQGGGAAWIPDVDPERDELVDSSDSV